MDNENVEFVETDGEVKLIGEGPEQFSAAETSWQPPKMTAQEFERDHPELFAQITEAAKAEGVKAERERLAQFAAQFSKDPTFCIEQFRAGVTIDEAMSLYAAKCEAERDELAAKMAEGNRQRIDPAVTEFCDEQKETTTAPEKKLKGPALYEHEFNEAGFDGKTAEQIQTEFADDLKSYCAFRRAQDGGQVRVFIRQER